MQAELDQAVNRVTARGAQAEGGQLGRIKDMTEDPEVRVADDLTVEV